MDREAVLHRLKDRHRNRPPIDKAWKWQSLISEYDKIKKIYLQSSLPALNCTKNEEGARGTHLVLYSQSHLHNNSLRRVVYCACAQRKRIMNP